jgi:hypothetical protein
MKLNDQLHRVREHLDRAEAAYDRGDMRSMLQAVLDARSLLDHEVAQALRDA